MEGETAAPYTILCTLHNSTNSQCLSNVPADMGSWWALGEKGGCFHSGSSLMSILNEHPRCAQLVHLFTS